MSTLTVIEDSDLSNRPRASQIVTVVRGREHVIQCRAPRNLGQRLMCPECGAWVRRLYLAEGDRLFGCAQCRKSKLCYAWRYVLKGKCTALRRQWPKDKHY